MIELKVKPGDTAYKIFPLRRGGFSNKQLFTEEILPITANNVKIIPKTISYGNGNKTIFDITYDFSYYEDGCYLEHITARDDDFGKTIFLPRAEAELYLNSKMEDC